MQFEIGKIYDGIVRSITPYGAFVELDKSTTGMVHISEISSAYVNNIKEHLAENQSVKVKIIGINEKGKISLSIKKAVNTGGSADKANDGFNRNSDKKRRPNIWEPKSSPHERGEPSFEDMLSKFKQNSEEKMGEIKRNIENKRKSSSRRGR